MVPLPLDGMALLEAVERALEGDSVSTAWQLSEPGDSPPATQPKAPEADKPLARRCSPISRTATAARGRRTARPSCRSRYFSDLLPPGPERKLADEVIKESGAPKVAPVLADDALFSSFGDPRRRSW